MMVLRHSNLTSYFFTPHPVFFSYLEEQTRWHQLLGIFSCVTLTPNKVVIQEVQAC